MLYINNYSAIKFISQKQAVFFSFLIIIVNLYTTFNLIK